MEKRNVATSSRVRCADDGLDEALARAASSISGVMTKVAGSGETAGADASGEDERADRDCPSS